LEYGFDNYQILETRPAGKTSTSEQVQIPAERIAASAPTAEEANASKNSDGYLLQLGSFRERDRAESLVKQFSADGFEVSMETNLLASGQTTYRVRVGPYAELLEAQEIARELLQKSGLRVLIIPAPPAEQQSTDNPS
jgi:cell division protein FtsN